MAFGDLEYYDYLHPDAWPEFMPAGLTPVPPSELGRGFQSPKATFPSDGGKPIILFDPEQTPQGVGFGYVEVRRIDSIAYSVVACSPSTWLG
jgi:hypothetical protein